MNIFMVKYVYIPRGWEDEQTFSEAVMAENWDGARAQVKARLDQVGHTFVRWVEE